VLCFLHRNYSCTQYSIYSIYCHLFFALINNDLPTTLEGGDEMIKASIGLQDLRRKIYLKAKADRLEQVE